MEGLYFRIEEEAVRDNNQDEKAPPISNGVHKAGNRDRNFSKTTFDLIIPLATSER